MNNPNFHVILTTTGTTERNKLLKNRALTGVAGQSVQPDSVLVVCDCKNNAHGLKHVTEIVHTVLPDARVLQNDRTPGLAGALNTGIMTVLKASGSKVNPDDYLLFLDDDDTWADTYTMDFAELLGQTSADVAACDFTRNEDGHESVIAAPDDLNMRDFLRGNPGIQGSNLIIRMSTVLKAGMFDEHMPSTTDRDLMVRVAMLEGIRYARLDRANMVHFASSRYHRLSTPGNPAKCKGLKRFFRKYSAWMTEDDARYFMRRARHVFKCDVAASAHSRNTPTRVSITDESPVEAELPEISLVMGVILDQDRVSLFSRSMDRLFDMFTGVEAAGVSGVSVVVLKNGEFSKSAERVLDDTARGARSRGVSWVQDHSETYLPISRARNRVQSLVRTVAVGLTNPVAWIKDDEAVFETLSWDGNRVVSKTDRDLPVLFRRLYRAYQDGHLDVGIGDVTGAPPIPAVATLRTQLLDLYYNLAFVLAGQVANTDNNLELMEKFPEYYYDLSHRHTQHLETPFLWSGTPQKPNSMSMKDILNTMDRIVEGNVPFRPLLAPAGMRNVGNLEPTVYRGGNTLIFNMDALKHENPVVKVNGKYSRRSDMLWAVDLVNNGFRVMRVPVWLGHDREGQDALDFDKLVRDIWGAAAYKALMDNSCQSREAFVRAFQHRVRERVAEAVAAFHRVLGLCQGIRNLVRQRGFGTDLAGVDAFTDRMAEQVIRGLAGLSRAVELQDEMAERHWSAVCEYHAKEPIHQPESMESPLVADAAACIRKEPGHELRMLGQGMEGVVLTDGVQVFKCIRKSLLAPEQQALLTGIKTRQLPWPLYDIKDAHAKGTWFVVTYDYEPLWPYQGGHGTEIVRLMRAFRRAGLISTNIAPWNLMVNRSGTVRCVDLGRDLAVYDDFGFEKMMRRAWLTFKFGDKLSVDEMKRLLRLTIHTDDFSEMRGFDLFKMAVLAPSKEDILDSWVIKRFYGRPSKVFDYGCGKGKLAHWFLRHPDTKEAVFYDPESNIERWRNGVVRAGPGKTGFYLASGVDRDDFVRTHAGRYDLVLNILVLCVIREDDEFQRVLSDLRTLVTPGGRVVVAVCNPLHVHGSTHIQQRIVPPNVTRDDTFDWKKKVYSTGSLRNDFHRPLETYLHAFARHGLEIEEVYQTPGVNTDTMLADSDFMVFILRPIQNRR